MKLGLRSYLGGAASVACGAALLLAVVSPTPAAAEPRKHHISVGLGVHHFMSDDFDDSDVETGGMGLVAYRLSLSPNVDLAFDTRGTVASSERLVDVEGTIYNADFNYRTSWVGPGVRYAGTGESVRPFIQANLYFVQEEQELEFSGIKVSGDEGGVGFGLQAGVDVRLSRLLSLPFEANLLAGSPENDLTSVGATVGLTFNFGDMP